jgi:hypothetical protein
VYLTCYWNMGPDNDLDTREFERIIQRFDSYNEVI